MEGWYVLSLTAFLHLHWKLDMVMHKMLQFRSKRTRACSIVAFGFALAKIWPILIHLSYMQIPVLLTPRLTVLSGF